MPLSFIVVALEEMMEKMRIEGAGRSPECCNLTAPDVATLPVVAAWVPTQRAPSVSSPASKLKKTNSC